MQLNRFTDLGLRALITLAHAPADRLLTVRLLAENLHVSQNHLVKVVYFMATEGWILSFKGRGGGIRLADETRTKPLGSLVRRLEEHSSDSAGIIDCSKPPCTLLPICPLPQKLNQAVEAFYRELDKFSLTDICQAPHPMPKTEVLNWIAVQAPSEN